MANATVMQNASSFFELVVIEAALLLCTQRVMECYTAGPPLIYEIRYNEKYTSLFGFDIIYFVD